MISRLLPSRLPATAAEQVRAFAESPRGLRNMRDEVSVLRASFAEAGALHTLGRKPLAVLTATGSLRKTSGWSTAQSRLAGLSSVSTHRVISSTHAGLIDDDASGASVQAIADVIAAIRTGQALPTR